MKYSLGLDIGTASVGWAVINEDKQRIEDLGVRIFERPEQPKTGESLAKPRRDARSARRRLKRRRQRLDYLKRFFVQHGLLSDEQIKNLLRYEKGYEHKDPYVLRAKAIKEKVASDELFVALYHIAKRRGYKSNRREVEKKDSEAGCVLRAIKENEPLLASHNGSVALTILNEEKFQLHKRNKDSEYCNSFIREDFEGEIRQILAIQEWSTNWIEELLSVNPNDELTRGKSGLFYQRPFMTVDLIRRMRGTCQYESGEPRAPKASYSFELFRLAQALAHLTYNDGEKLTPEQIKVCILKAHDTETIKYKTLRKVLGFDEDVNFHFDFYIRGKQEKGDDNDFEKLKFYHTVRKTFKACPEVWEDVKADVELIDAIGEALTINKDDESLTLALNEIGLPQEVIAELIKVNVSGFGHLSLLALRKITPFLLQGFAYDKAVEQVYPGEFAEKLSGDRNELPPLDENQLQQLTNPVVKRAVSQTRKVINAVIRKYGAPCQIKIECATDLAKNWKDRKDIERKQKENAENNERIKGKLEELGAVNPNGRQIVKYKLYEQQKGQCVYCGTPISVADILTDDRCIEVDHIVPFSICGNDGINNKVLACAKCNQEKKNHIPFEVWGSDLTRWEKIKTLANDLSIPSFVSKKVKCARILCEKPPKEGWNERALNDTRYMSKFLMRYIKDNLRFSDKSSGKQKVIAPNGQMTSYLRKIYGIGSKDRDINNCHHAVDACIIATVSQNQIKKVSEWNKYGELGAKWHNVVYEDENGEQCQITTGDYDVLRGMLPPWENFAKEVQIRSGMSYDVGKIEKLSDFRDKFRDFPSYDEEFLQRIHPLFVSRMPKHGVGGAAHEETLRSPKVKDDVMRLTRKKLDKKFAQNYVEGKKRGKTQDTWLERSVLLDSDKVLYEQLKCLLEEKGENAFDEPVYKNNKQYDKNGCPLSPVRTVKVYEKKPDTSGTYLNHGTQFVDNGKTVCLNIYRRKGRYFAAPLYEHSLNKKSIPILPVPDGRGKEEKADFDAIRESNGIILATKENGFELVAQVFPNDYIRITYPGHVMEGYYVKYGIANGQVSMISHNQSGKDDAITCCLGSAVGVEILPVSVLGDSYKFE